ncbi:hypothetical protein P8C59_007034 [Phyllachora maydis]|uniref:Uncharacterized protein n=1 Tax=Phyllachora maydis TaxID=1825666 RepID=A0AAD9I7M6_9PEZI|nr:hypothetical protein P8C59_007034 [Phyllachora maydis]
MYMYIACLPYCCYYYNSSFTNLLIANIDSLSNLDDLVNTILGISTVPLALVPIPAKPAKIMPAVYCIAAYKAKRRKLAKACATAGRAVAAKRYKKYKKAAANAQASKLAKKEGLRRSKRTAGSNAGRYTTNSSLMANKDNNNAYNRVYIPPADIEEEKGSSSNDNGVNSSTSNNTDKGKGSNTCKYSKGALYCKDTLPYKRHSVLARPIIARYLEVLIASKPASA